MDVFLDGTGITPGTEKCHCGPECEFPCWQRLGIAPACEGCGCPPFPPERLFARLAMPVRVGQILALPGHEGRWQVETAKVADDGRDAKCVVFRVRV